MRRNKKFRTLGCEGKQLEINFVSSCNNIAVWVQHHPQHTAVFFESGPPEDQHTSQLLSTCVICQEPQSRWYFFFFLTRADAWCNDYVTTWDVCASWQSAWFKSRLLCSWTNFLLMLALWGSRGGSSTWVPAPHRSSRWSLLLAQPRLFQASGTWTSQLKIFIYISLFSCMSLWLWNTMKTKPWFFSQFRGLPCSRPRWDPALGPFPKLAETVTPTTLLAVVSVATSPHLTRMQQAILASIKTPATWSCAVRRLG